MTNVMLNSELNGVEVYFEGKPVKTILDSLKAVGFRWNGKKVCWYAKQNEQTLAEANKYIEDNKEIAVEIVTETKKATSKKSKIASLWDRVQFIEGTADTSKYSYRFVGSNYTGLSTKDTAKEIRTHLKKQFPEVKFSVTSDYNHIEITIKSSPYCWEKLEYSYEIECSEYRAYEEEHNKELLAIKEYCSNLVDSYNYDDSDTMSDYFHTHFYSNVSIDYDYTQIEQNEAVKSDVENFRAKLVEADKLEEERKEREYQEYLKKQEIEKAQYDARMQEEAKQVEDIYNSVDVVELEEDNQYFIVGSQFANLNKNCTLEQYQNEVAKGDYTLENVKVTRELHFTSKEALENFSNLLLNDFSFLENSGGTYTDDARINTMTDYDHMTEEERETVQWNLCGIAVYFENKLQFIIDTQGFSYSRYVGLVDNVIMEKQYNSNPIIDAEQLEVLISQAESLEDYSTEVIEQNNLVKVWNNDKWNEYKELIKTKLKDKNFGLTKTIIQQLPEDSEVLKVAMYKLLKEVDGIQEQFKNSNIQQGQKLTMFYIGDWGSMITNRVTFDSVEYTSYAQYNNAVKVTYTPQNKRSKYYNYWYKTLLVFEGWHELPDHVLNNIEERNGVTIKSTKYLSCDKKQYDEIIEYFAGQGIEPVINTYKPIF